MAALVERAGDSDVHAASDAHGWHWVVNPDYESMLRAHGLSSPELLFRMEGERLDKAGLSDWRERIRLRLGDRGSSPAVLFLKRYDSPPLSVQLRRVFGPHGHHSTAGIERYWIEELRAARIACPVVVALAECMNGLWEERSAILLAPVPGIPMESWVAQHAGRVPRSMLDTLAQFVSRFHHAGFVHRDLYLSHIFFEPDWPVPFHLIDLQRLLRPRLLRRRWIVKDLAALNYSTPLANATASDRLRWLRTYLSTPRLDRRAKSLARAVLAKTRRIAAHDRSRNSRHAQGRVTG